MKSGNALTKQELVVLEYVAKGWRNAQIARELTVSVRTVETHLTNIFSKLDVSTRTEAALRFMSEAQPSNGNLRRNHDDTPGASSYPLN